MCWRSSPDRERPMVRLRRSTAGLNICAGLLWGSVTSPTTSPGVCSSPVASDRFYTLNYDEPEMVWSHTVYLGVYSLADIYESLHRVFHDDADVYDERPPGRSACAGLLIDARGQLVHESPILSSALWATGRASTQGPSDSEWAEGFDRAFSSFAKTAASREEQRIDDFMKRFRDR